LPKPGPRMRLVICSSAGDADDADAGHGAVLCARDDTGVCTNTLISLTQLAREGSPPPELRLPQPELSRKFNQVGRARIRRFESYVPSQAVRSLGGICGLEKCFRHFRDGRLSFKYES
jgi:hypothetical protein